MHWADVVADSNLENLPYKIELNEHGSDSDGTALAPAFRAPECPAGRTQSAHERRQSRSGVCDL